MTRVIIADPDPASRNAMFLWLVYKLGIDDIVQMSDGRELMEQIEERLPDIVLMDWSLPHRPTLENCQYIQQKHAGLQWVILSVDPKVSNEVMSFFPWFLQKGSSPETVFSLLKKVIVVNRTLRRKSVSPNLWT